MQNKISKQSKGKGKGEITSPPMQNHIFTIYHATDIKLHVGSLHSILNHLLLSFHFIPFHFDYYYSNSY